MRDLVYILGDPYPPECEGSVFIDPGCDESGTSGGNETGEVDATSSSGTGTSAGMTSSSGAEQDVVGGGGCGSCRVQDRGSPYGSALLLLALAGLRRRRSSPS